MIDHHKSIRHVIVITSFTISLFLLIIIMYLSVTNNKKEISINNLQQTTQTQAKQPERKVENSPPPTVVNHDQLLDAVDELYAYELAVQTK